MSDFWIALGALGAVVQSLVIAVVAILALRQLRESRRSRVVASFFPLFDSINSAEAAALRRRLHTEVRGDPADYSDEQEDIVNGIVNQFDYLGFLVSNRLLDRDLVVSFYYGTIIRSWRSALPYVTYQRRLRGTKFAGYFESLRNDCFDYVKRALPEIEIRRFDGLRENESNA